jgi:hypothetical protein
MESSTVTTQETDHMPPLSSHPASDAGENLQFRMQMQMDMEIQQLPPTDHGKQAYLVLAACTLIQVPVWGQSSDAFYCYI